MKGVIDNNKMNLAREIELFESGLPCLVRKCSLSFYKNYFNLPFFKNDISINQAKQIIEQIPIQDLQDCYKIIDNSKKKTNRIRKRIETMLFQLQFYDNLKAYFITLTFNDNTMNSTNEDTRHQKVFRTLKNLPGLIDYVANIDYGKENEREHYHGIILVNESFNFEKTKINNLFKFSLPIWDKVGFSDLKEVKILNEKALSKYINKFTNHAKKDTTKKKRVIYCKNPIYPALNEKKQAYFNEKFKNRTPYKTPKKILLMWFRKKLTRIYNEELPFKED